MMIHETVKKVAYSNGNRVTTVEQVATRADDCVRLGQLYIQLGDVYRRLEDGELPEKVKTNLESNLETILKDIEMYRGYVSGYEV